MTSRVLVGDCLAQMRTFPADLVHTVVTSPPYWGLRDYGMAGQLGMERTPEEYVARLVDIFREARRVLRPDGTVWLNLGDTFAASGRGGNATKATSTLEGGHRSQEASMRKRLAEWRQPKPSTPEASAGVAPLAPSRPAAPRVVDSTEKTMTIREKIEGALREHGPMTTRQMREHGLKDATLAQHCHDLATRKLLKTVGGGERSKVYALPDQKAATSGFPPSNEAKALPVDSPYAGALADLCKKRNAMQADLTKLDVAIAAIEALG